MKTNELKKGDYVLLSSGWYATIMDNKRGNIRMAEVEGIHKELGSVYAHDIVSVVRPNGALVPIDHTPAQVKLASTVGSLFQ